MDSYPNKIKEIIIEKCNSVILKSFCFTIYMLYYIVFRHGSQHQSYCPYPYQNHDDFSASTLSNITYLCWPLHLVARGDRQAGPRVGDTLVSHDVDPEVFWDAWISVTGDDDLRLMWPSHWLEFTGDCWFSLGLCGDWFSILDLRCDGDGLCSLSSFRGEDGDLVRDLAVWPTSCDLDDCCDSDWETVG